jgi:hypothetical protein
MLAPSAAVQLPDGVIGCQWSCAVAYVSMTELGHATRRCID